MQTEPCAELKRLIYHERDQMKQKGKKFEVAYISALNCYLGNQC